MLTSVFLEYHWYYENIMGYNHLATLAQAIEQETVMVVCDGSFQGTYATAALIIEDQTSLVIRSYPQGTLTIRQLIGLKLWGSLRPFS
jgi:hypothetical protein